MISDSLAVGRDLNQFTTPLTIHTHTHTPTASRLSPSSLAHAYIPADETQSRFIMAALFTLEIISKFLFEILITWLFQFSV